MESIIAHPLIKVTSQDMKKTRDFYSLDDPERIKESVEVIQEWCQMQEHFVEKNLHRNLLERIFILSRGSVEGTKRKIDSLCTSRGMMPELSLNRTVEEFERFWSIVNYVPLPKLCPRDQSRVMVTQILTDKLDEFSLLTYFRYCFLIGEYRLNYDYTTSERYIIDLVNFNMTHLSKINPIVVKKAEVLATEGFGTKINGIHILNAPPFIDKLVFLLKQALKEKVAKRIHVHANYEELQEHMPKEILPVDYLGDEQSVTKLAAQWRDELKTEKAKKIIKDFDKMVTDESKRQSAKFNEDYLGMPGSFRRLNVD